MRISSWAGLAALTVGCNYSGDWLLPPPIEGVPAVIDLGEIEPASGFDGGEIRDRIIFAEVGPGDGVLPGGASARFTGSGGPMCVWMDPELVFWNQAVGARESGGRNWSWPDNTYDDGDIDMEVGPAVIYDGIPGERVGDFTVRQRDELGNEFIATIQSCAPGSLFASNVVAHGGRGAPEVCELAETEAGVPYTIALSAWTLPLDDYRLSFGLVVYDGPCVSFDRAEPGLANALSGDPNFADVADRTNWQECIISGESVPPSAEGGPKAAAAGLPARTWLGADEVVSHEGSQDFEDAFCVSVFPEGDGGGLGGAADRLTPLRDFCEAEATAVAEAGKRCSWAFGPDVEDEIDTKCYCGDLSDSPGGGTF